MKTSPSQLCVLSAAILCSLLPSLHAQTTATTDPVGFITLNVAGTGGTVSNQLSFVGLGLTRTIEYQGSAETVGANTLTDNDATWTDNQFNGAAGSYFLEVSSGTGAGTTYDIVGTTAGTKTITLGQNLAAGVANGASFKIRKHWTISSIFGAANESGLQPGSSTTADQILIYNNLSSIYDTYFYSNVGGLIGNGWRKVGGGSANQANTVVYPDEGVIVKRLQSSNLSVVLMGAVKTGQTSIPVQNGLNFSGNVYGANMTLGSCGIYTGSAVTGLAPGSSTTADNIQIYNGSTYDKYFYSNVGGLIGNGWRKVGGGSTDQTNVPIPVGQSIVIERKTAGGFSWVAPQHPANL